MIIESSNSQKICHIYEVINYNNVSLINEFDFEIFHKKSSDDSKEIDRSEECPANFTKLNAGCFHANSSHGGWFDAYTYCAALVPSHSHLAVLASVEVSKHLLIVTSLHFPHPLMLGSYHFFIFCTPAREGQMQDPEV